MLSTLCVHNHPHLFSLLFTYTFGGRFRFVFPYEDVTLRKYWDDRPQPDFDKSTVLWSIKQMLYR